MKKKNKSLVILLHEIYGINGHMVFIQKLLEDAGYDVICPNLLNRQSYDYADEKEAYLNYRSKVNFENSLDNIKGMIEDNVSRYKSIYVVGFSVGGTTAWLCSKLNINGIVSFYGSRIRDYVGVEPNCPALLIFARQETSFEPEELVNRLRQKTNVKACIFDGKHGFADPFSKHYDHTLFNQAKEIMIKFLSEQ